MANDSVIQVRISSELKDEAILAFNAMGLSISEGIRVLITQVAKDNKLAGTSQGEDLQPFDRYHHKFCNDVYAQLEYSSVGRVSHR